MIVASGPVMFLFTPAALFNVAGVIAVADVIMVGWDLRAFDRERLLRGT